jgi:hypothetical protein
MKLILPTIAILAALTVVVGCGSEASSGRPPQDRSTEAAEPESHPAPVAPVKASGQQGDSGTAATPIPRGTPLKAKDPRVQRAIADLLHPEQDGQDQKPPRDDHQGEDKKGGRGGVLDQILRDLRKNAEQLQPDDHPSKQEGGIKTILEMLK